MITRRRGLSDGVVGVVGGWLVVGGFAVVVGWGLV
jgi:hypothetical protein